MTSYNKKQASLCRAAETGNIKRLTALLRNGADPDLAPDTPKSAFELGEVPLAHAIDARQTESVRTLLEWGADPNIKISWSERLLERCIGEQCYDIVRLMLRHGADPYWRYEYENYIYCCILDSAYRAGDRDFIAAYIDEMPEGANTQEPRYGETLLHKAVQDNDKELCVYLLKKGANPLLRNTSGKSALDMVRDGTPLFEFLNQAARAFSGRQESAKEKLKDIRPDEEYGETIPPIFQAVSTGDEALVEEMLRRGEAPGRKRRDLSTPLHEAARLGRTGCVRLLLKYGAEVNARDYLEQTPLYLAAYNDHTETVRILMKVGADPEIITEYPEETPLMACATHKTTRTAEELLRGGAKPLTKDPQGFTALDLARENHNQDLLQLLEIYANNNKF